jgi:hypothetical protein
MVELGKRFCYRDCGSSLIVLNPPQCECIEGDAMFHESTAVNACYPSSFSLFGIIYTLSYFYNVHKVYRTSSFPCTTEDRRLLHWHKFLTLKMKPYWKRRREPFAQF